MLLSVIIPIYKTPEDLLAKCLSSVAELPRDETEVLCIVDGPEAMPRGLMEDVARQYPWFQIIANNENKGVSHSRNVGIGSARGLYVTFVDADDLINADTYLRAAQKCLIWGLDLCKFRLGEKSDSLGSGSCVFSCASWNDNAFRANLLRAIEWAGLSSVAAIYSSRLLGEFGISFCEDLQHNEDFVFVTKVFQACSCVGLLDEIGYSVVGHQASASRSPVSERMCLDRVSAGIRVMQSIDVSRMTRLERCWYLRKIIRENLLPDFTVRRLISSSGRIEFLTGLSQMLSLVLDKFADDLRGVAKGLLKLLSTCPDIILYRPCIFILRLFQHFDKFVVS